MVGMTLAKSNAGFFGGGEIWGDFFFCSLCFSIVLEFLITQRRHLQRKNTIHYLKARRPALLVNVLGVLHGVHVETTAMLWSPTWGEP